MGFDRELFSHPQMKKFINQSRGFAPSEKTFRNIRILDVFSGRFVPSSLTVADGYIVGIHEDYEADCVIDGLGAYVVPGFIDAHVHIESSMMTPARFQEAVLPLGTTSVIWDPHEIANVRGMAGIQWALQASEDLELDVFVMVPSCVPSTPPEWGLETSGAHLTAKDIEEFKDQKRVIGLAEMMNFPGVLQGDEEVLAKLSSYHSLKKDGHCPGLSGKDLNAYAFTGIHSCHESTSLDEAKEKLQKGIHVLIREGSCAKNASTLVGLVDPYTSSELGLCSDDRNPFDIAHEGHINFIIELGLKKGLAPEALFRAASYGAAKLYQLNDRGALAPGYLADFLLVEPKDQDWQKGFAIREVYKKGQLVEPHRLAEQKSLPLSSERPNLNLKPVRKEHFKLEGPKGETGVAHVIGVIPNQIITEHLKHPLTLPQDGVFEPEQEGFNKIAVFERHRGLGYHQVALVKGFDLKAGAIASSVNHDSHNIIVVGHNDEAMALAVNALIDMDGGICVISQAQKPKCLALPLGGLMTDAAPQVISEELSHLKEEAYALGCPLHEPFLHLSFLALPVIGDLKITDRGLVDVLQFKKIPWFSVP